MSEDTSTDTTTDETTVDEPHEPADHVTETVGGAVEDGDPTVEDTAVPVAFEEAPEPETLAAFGPVRVARVYVCERGHRTTTLWGQPETCQAQPLRSGPACGLPLYHITELPEQVQKALNPLKASKKASKKK